MRKSIGINLFDKDIDVIGSLFSLTHIISSGFSSIRNKDYLNQTQEKALMLVSNNQGRTIGEYCVHVSIDQGAFSRTIMDLERKKYIYRSHDDNDRRKILLFPSESGKNEAERIRNNMSCYVKKLISVLSPEDQKRFKEAMNIIADINAQISPEKFTGNRDY